MARQAKLPTGITRYSDGSYGVDYRDGTGGRVRKKIGTKDDAIDYLAEITRRKRVGEVLPERQEAPVSLAFHLQAYQDSSNNATDKLFAGKWIDLLGEYAPHHVTVTVLRDWIRGMREAGRSESTIGRWLSPLRAVYTRLVERRIIRHKQNPFAIASELGLRRPEEGRTFFLQPEQEARFWDALGPVWSPYVAFSIMTGIRFGNLARAEWPHVHWVSQTLRLPKTKNGKAHVVHLSPAALELLREMQGRAEEYEATRRSRMASGRWKDRPPCPWVFPSAHGRQLQKDNWRRIWRAAANQAGIDGYTHHGTRHTMASRLLMSGSSLAEVMEALGVGSPRMVRRYAHLADSHMRGVMSRVQVSSWSAAAVPSPSVDDWEPGCAPTMDAPPEASTGKAAPLGLS